MNSIDKFKYLYAHALLNIEKLNYRELKEVFVELRLEFLAKVLKYKFNDLRSIPELKQIIKEEIKDWDSFFIRKTKQCILEEISFN